MSIKSSDVFACYVQGMLEYQRIHNITNMCYVNSMLLRDTVITLYPMMRLRAFFAVYNKTVDGEVYVVGHVHMAVVNNVGDVLDPSYEVAQYSPVTYIDNYAEFKEFMPSITKLSLDGKAFRYSSPEIVQFFRMRREAERLNSDMTRFLADGPARDYYFNVQTYAVQFVAKHMGVELMTLEAHQNGAIEVN